MIRRAKWHGGAKYAAPSRGGTYRVSPATRVYVLAGTTDPPSVYQLPYTADKSGTALSEVLQVELGAYFIFIIVGVAGRKISIEDRSGTEIVELTVGETGKVTYCGENSWYGTWRADVRTNL